MFRFSGYWLVFWKVDDATTNEKNGIQNIETTV